MVFVDHLEKDIFALRTKPLHVQGHMTEVTEIVHCKFILSITIEEVSSSQQIEENRPKTEDVTVVAVTHFLKDLRCHITWRTTLLEQDFVLWCLSSKT